MLNIFRYSLQNIVVLFIISSFITINNWVGWGATHQKFCTVCGQLVTYNLWFDSYKVEVRKLTVKQGKTTLQKQQRIKLKKFLLKKFALTKSCKRTTKLPGLVEVFTNAQHLQSWQYCHLCVPIHLQFPSLI